MPKSTNALLLVCGGGARSIAQYRGNYDAFEEARAEKLRCDAKAAEGSERQRKHVQGRGGGEGGWRSEGAAITIP